MVRECALLSITFSDVLTFHITKNRYRLVMRLIKAIFEVAIGLLPKMNPRMYVISPLCSKPDSRNLDASVDPTLLLFLISESPFNSDESVSWVQDGLIAELARIWEEQSGKPHELPDFRLYDYFNISFIRDLSWDPLTWDSSKPKEPFLDNYGFPPRYQKKIAMDKLGLCMERLWVR